MLVLFTKAVGIGLLLAVPLGPIGLLCLHRSLTLGMVAGMAVGLGAATADGIYAAAAAFALSIVAPIIADTAWLGAAGGVALIVIGLKDVLQQETASAPPTLRRQMGVYAGVVLLTLANPATVLTFAAIILGLGLVPDMASLPDGFVFVAGVFVGSSIWWMVLSFAGDRLRHRLPPGTVNRSRKLAGVAFIGFGVYAVLS